MKPCTPTDEECKAALAAEPKHSLKTSGSPKIAIAFLTNSEKSALKYVFGAISVSGCGTMNTLIL